MKLAKKVLAVLVAVMMLAGTAAMAFAAGTPTVNIEATEKDGKVTVKVYFDDAVGLKSYSLLLKYDHNVLDYQSLAQNKRFANGTDTNTTKTLGDGVACALSEGALGEDDILFGGYFGDVLYSTTDWADFGDEDAPVNVNGEHFYLAKLTFTVLKEEQTDLIIEVANDGDFGLAAGAKVTLFAAAPTEPTEPSESTPAPTEPSESTPAPSESEPAPSESEPAPSESEAAPSESEAAPSESEAAPSESEAVSGEPVPGSTEAANGGNGGNGGPKTGDNMALAAAAAVVVLAGAAFVVSKKRK